MYFNGLSLTIPPYIFHCRRFIDSNDRIECRISGTYDPLIASTSPANTESVIVFGLLNSSYLVPDTNTSEGKISQTIVVIMIRIYMCLYVHVLSMYACILVKA